MEKNDKRITIICIIISIILLLTICILKFKDNIMVDNNVPDGYIAVFNGGAGEITYSTYVYKIDNGQDNYGFKYINTVNTTKSWGSSDWNVKVVKKGNIDWTDGVFIVAKDHGAYSYVISDGQTYTIDEFADRFLMD